jgi:hypothetical protein
MWVIWVRFGRDKEFREFREFREFKELREENKNSALDLRAHLKFSIFNFQFSQMRVSESRANEFALPSGSILDKIYFVNSNRRLTAGGIGAAWR